MFRNGAQRFLQIKMMGVFISYCTMLGRSTGLKFLYNTPWLVRVKPGFGGRRIGLI